MNFQWLTGIPTLWGTVLHSVAYVLLLVWVPGLEPRDASGGGFADVLRGAVNDGVETLNRAEQVSRAAAAGKADVNEVITAVSEAELTLQTVVALRDRVIQAYQEILRMPI